MFKSGFARKMTVAVALGALLTMSAVGVAEAGRVRASISLAGSGDVNVASVAEPTFAGTVSFDVVADSKKESDLYSLWVKNACFVDGVLVYAEYQPVNSGFAGPFTLGPTAAWQGGAADCQAFVWSFPNSETPIRGAVVNYSVAP